jgi:outer membrane protein assembly factor BamB
MIRLPVPAAIPPAFLALALVLAPETAPAEPGDILRTVQRGTRMDGSPAYADDGTVHIGSDDRFLYAIRGADGVEKWRYETGGAIFSSPAIGADGTIYVGSDDGFLHAVAPDGERRWRFEIGAPVRSSPGIGPDGTVHVGAQDGRIHAIDGADGTSVWVFSTDGPVSGHPAIDDAGTTDDRSDDTVYFGSEDGNLYALGSDGRLRWRFETEGPVRASPALGSDRTVYIGSDDGRMYALDPDGANPRRRWAFETGGPVRASAALSEDGTLHFGSGDGFLYALRTADGVAERMRWRFDAESAVESSPALGSDGTIYFGARNGLLRALESDGRPIWSVRIGDTISSPLIAPDGTLFIGARNDAVGGFAGGRLLAAETGSPGPAANSSWPMFGHDVRRTGRNSPNRAPVADAGADRTVSDGESVLLDGTGSTDPDYGIADFAWLQVSGPTTTLAEEGATAARFVARGESDETLLVFELTVADIGGLRSSDTVSIAVEDDDSFCFVSALGGDGGRVGIPMAGILAFLAARIRRGKGRISGST